VSRKCARFISVLSVSLLLAFWWGSAEIQTSIVAKTLKVKLNYMGAGPPVRLDGEPGKMEPKARKESRPVVAALAFGESPSITSPTARSEQSSNPKDDLEAIRQTALDYIEGWYVGSAPRMERSLHRDLIKRTVRNNRLDLMTKTDLVAHTRHGKIEGKSWKITIFDVYDNIATVKVDSTDYMDYLQVGKVEGKWVIVNVLWSPKK
jgi:hypothetical protein